MYYLFIINLIILLIVGGIVLNYYNFSKHLSPNLQNIVFYLILNLGLILNLWLILNLGLILLRYQFSFIISIYVL